MASVAVTAAWADPSSSLTSGDTYIVQNKSTQAVQFYEGDAFDAATNGGDGVILTSLNDGGSGPNSMRWQFDSSKAVRMRTLAAPFGDGNTIEFFPAV